MKKKYGGRIKNWQVHQLTISQEAIDKLYPNQGAKPLVFTGTVVEDPTGRWQPGDHMRSSLIVKINKGRTKIETLNTKYNVTDEDNNILPELGNGALKIFY
jgi:hypothetical protein